MPLNYETQPAGPMPRAALKARSVCAPSPREEAGQRIDNFLMRHFKAVPRSRVYRCCARARCGSTASGWTPSTASRRATRCACRRCESTRRGAGPALEQSDGIDRKGGNFSGQALAGDRQARGSRRARGQRHELRSHRGAAGLAAARDSGLVHRLDRDTSGCLAIARDRATLTALHALIRDRRHAQDLSGAGVGQLAARYKAHRRTAGDRRSSARRAARAGGRGRQGLGQPVQAGAILRQPRHIDGSRHSDGPHPSDQVHAAFAGHPLLGDDKYGDASAMPS